MTFPGREADEGRAENRERDRTRKQFWAARVNAMDGDEGRGEGDRGPRGRRKRRENARERESKMEKGERGRSRERESEREGGREGGREGAGATITRTSVAATPSRRSMWPW